jgi:hypothetical protein
MEPPVAPAPPAPDESVLEPEAPAVPRAEKKTFVLDEEMPRQRRGVPGGGEEAMLAASSPRDCYHEMYLRKGQKAEEGPDALTPFTLDATEAILPKHIELRFYRDGGEFTLTFGAETSHALSRTSKSFAPVPAARAAQGLVTIKGCMSPLLLLDNFLDAHARKEFGIPGEATHYAWVPPNSADSKTVNKCFQYDPDMRLFHNGGMLFCKVDGEVLCVKALRPDSLGRLRFGAKKACTEELTQKLLHEGRIHPLKIERLREEGASHFSYIHPKEDVGAGAICPRGGFALFYRGE